MMYIELLVLDDLRWKISSSRALTFPCFLMMEISLPLSESRATPAHLHKHRKHKKRRLRTYRVNGQNIVPCTFSSSKRHSTTFLARQKRPPKKKKKSTRAFAILCARACVCKWENNTRGRNLSSRAYNTCKKGEYTMNALILDLKKKVVICSATHQLNRSHGTRAAWARRRGAPGSPSGSSASGSSGRRRFLQRKRNIRKYMYNIHWHVTRWLIVLICATRRRVKETKYRRDEPRTFSCARDFLLETINNIKKQVGYVCVCISRASLDFELPPPPIAS